MHARAISIVWLACSALAGCVGVRTPDAGKPLRLDAGEGVVFGRVRVFDRGIEIDPWTIEPKELWSEDPVIRFALFQIESGRKYLDAPVKAGGRFEWILPAGTYLLYHTPTVVPPYNEPLAAFQVRADSEAVDLGELELLVSVDRPLSEELATYTVSGVESSPPTEQSTQAFVRNHPGTTNVRSGAWTVDPALRELFEDWSKEACERVLARHGLHLATR